MRATADMTPADRERVQWWARRERNWAALMSALALLGPAALGLVLYAEAGAIEASGVALPVSFALVMGIYAGSVWKRHGRYRRDMREGVKHVWTTRDCQHDATEFSSQQGWNKRVELVIDGTRYPVEQERAGDVPLDHIQKKREVRVEATPHGAVLLAVTAVS